MHRIPRTLLLFALAFPLIVTGCDDAEPDDDHGPGEEELITRVIISLEGPGNDDPVVTISDASGLNEEGDVFDEPLELTAGATYDGSIRLLDESDPDDVEEITNEVRAEAEEHQFFYTVSGIAGVTFTIDDVDDNGLPVGLDFTVTVADDADGSGTLRIQLGHYDEGPKDGVTLSDETDVDFRIPIDVTD